MEFLWGKDAVIRVCDKSCECRGKGPSIRRFRVAISRFKEGHIEGVRFSDGTGAIQWLGDAAVEGAAAGVLTDVDEYIRRQGWGKAGYYTLTWLD